MSIRKRCAPCSVTESEMRAAKRQLSNKPVKRIPRTRIHFPSAAASLVATARSMTAPITTRHQRFRDLVAGEADGRGRQLGSATFGSDRACDYLTRRDRRVGWGTVCLGRKKWCRRHWVHARDRGR